MCFHKTIKTIRRKNNLEARLFPLASGSLRSRGRAADMAVATGKRALRHERKTTSTAV